MQNSHLVVENLSAGYGDTRILNGIDLAVEKGQFVALLGASGCGKTTLLRTIAGFEKPQAGRITVAERDVTQLPPDRRGMSMVFQSYALWPHKTVAQHIAYGLRLRGVPTADIATRVAAMERMLGLEGLGARKPANLSGGQRQRVALGRALAVEPDILLLDEPLSNLDARIRLQLRVEIRDLQQRLGITAIHVTHDREEAMVMADRIVVLNAGQVMQDGAPQDLYNRPNSSFVAAFMGIENTVVLTAVQTAEGAAFMGDDSHDPLVLHDRVGPGLVEVRFRPHGATLTDAEARPYMPTGTLTLKGRVTGVTYPGGGWLHSVQIGPAQVSVFSPSAFAVSDPVALHIPPDALFLFGADAAPKNTVTGTGLRGRRDAGLIPA